MYRIAKLLALTPFVAIPAATLASPFTPANPAAVIEVLDERNSPEWREIEKLHEAMDAQPESAALAAALAGRYIDLYRTEGDPRLVGYASAVLVPWRDSGQAPTEVLWQLAVIDQLLHRFDAAEQRLDRVLDRNRADGNALAMRAAIALTRGRLADSRRDCARLYFVADAVSGSGCTAAVLAMNGQARQALALLDSVLDRHGARFDSHFEAWLSTLAAETAAALGRTGDADARFRRALAASRRDARRPSVYLLCAYADFLLDSGRPGDAAALLADAPVNDSTLLRLVAARKMLGESIDIERGQLADRLRLPLAERPSPHLREAAYFAARIADRPQLAVRLARANFAVQREALDARLLLEAAAAACNRAAATPVLAWIDETVVENVALDAARAALAERCT